ncbi:MAG: MmcQ/YjbR family DNA-binding protein [Devosia sp.]
MSVASESELQRMLRLCRELGLPEVAESTSYGSPSLKVRAKNFASVRGPQEMVLHCPLEQKDLLMEMAPHIYWQTDHFTGWPGLLVRLDVIEDEELKLRLEDAWRFRAPKLLAEGYAQSKGMPVGES